MSVRVAIPIPTSFDPEYNDRSWPEYARAVETSGGEAVAVPLNLSSHEISDLVQSCRAVVLPGSGADVNPDRYGHTVEPETAAADAAREAVDWQMLAYVEQTGTPLLAICFGLQSLNVYRGGTLVQHLLPMPVNHRAGRSVSAAHATLVAAGSRLGKIAMNSHEPVADAEQAGFARLMVNSSHHQAVGTPGDGLTIVARSLEDAVIEGLEDPEHRWLTGVQWHPERTMETSATSRAIFRSLIEAAR